MKKIIVIISICLCCNLAKGAYIDFYWDKNNNDSISLSIRQLQITPTTYTTFVKGKFENGHFYYQLPETPFPQYISFLVNGNLVMMNKLVEPSDSLQINFSERLKYNVIGRGSEKWYCRKVIDSLLNNAELIRKLRNKNNPADSISWIELHDFQKKIVTEFKSSISPMAYTYLLADILSFAAIGRLVTLNSAISSDTLSKDSWIRKELTSLEGFIALTISATNDSLLSLCMDFPELVIRKKRLDITHNVSLPYDLQSMLDLIAVNYNGLIRKRLLFGVLVEKRKSESFLKLSQNLLPEFTDPRQMRVLTQMVDMYKPGNDLSAAVFSDLQNKQVALVSYKDTILLLDFWFTGCKACIAMQKSLAPLEQKMDGKPFKIVSISIDRDIELWKKSVASGLYTNKGHINLRTGDEGNDHEFIKQFQINGYPTLMLIDKNGKLITTAVTDPRSGNIDGILNKIHSAL